MEVKQINCEARCDNGACTNRADYILFREDTALPNQLKLCEPCLKEIYTSIGKTLTPKSPKNILSRKDGQ